jgi:hypothetical protein
MKWLHRLIVWYLRRCGGAFHHGPYGEQGRYVELMTDAQYSRRNLCELTLREILMAHGMYGDGGNLDLAVRRKCLAALEPHQTPDFSECPAK